MIDQYHRKGKNVLIETLWNVKQVVDELAESILRINRNIVECKDDINLQVFELGGVLIETLWNVKFVGTLLVFVEVSVLIETLWNVKIVRDLNLDKIQEY